MPAPHRLCTSWRPAAWKRWSPSSSSCTACCRGSRGLLTTCFCAGGLTGIHHDQELQGWWYSHPCSPRAKTSREGIRLAMTSLSPSYISKMPHPPAKKAPDTEETNTTLLRPPSEAPTSFPCVNDSTSFPTKNSTVHSSLLRTELQRHPAALLSRHWQHLTLHCCPVEAHLPNGWLAAG